MLASNKLGKVNVTVEEISVVRIPIEKYLDASSVISRPILINSEAVKALGL